MPERRLVLGSRRPADELRQRRRGGGRGDGKQEGSPVHDRHRLRPRRPLTIRNMVVRAHRYTVEPGDSH
jgi:hypothetical protein